MSVVLELEPEVEDALKKKATLSGFPMDSYIKNLIERDISPRPTLDEILAPFRREVEASGLTDDDLDALVEEAREEIYRERKECESAGN